MMPKPDKEIIREEHDRTIPPDNTDKKAPSKTLMDQIQQNIRKLSTGALGK